MASIPVPVTRRGSALGGLIDILTTVDHKKIGLVYIVSSFIFFILSGLLALGIRTQLAVPNNTFLPPEAYNMVFTMHGTGMIFLFVIPILTGGFGNYLVPLQIGARDMAFPRMNAFSLWMFIFAAILIMTGVTLAVVGYTAQIPSLTQFSSSAAWTAYVPLSSKQFSPQIGMDLWVLGVIALGISSTLGAVNFLVTIYAMRAPGMTAWRMPMFTWSMTVTAAMILVATPVLTAAMIMLIADRQFGTQFFSTSNARLWQHMFWFYSHPAVYIMVVPAMGMLSEILPVFSRKPIFGPKVIILSTVAIGVLGFTTWAHHMFVSGISPEVERFFMFTTMVIAVPTGVKIFNWIATMWGGSLNFKTPLLMGFGFLSTFVVGGITGVVQGAIPLDAEVHNSYWVVAHFHYVLFGGSVFGIFGGLYYWMPKFTGKMLDEKLGKLHFWTMFVGFNLTFFPMHILGLMGMPRRIAVYPDGRGWEVSNLVATIGAFMIALSVLIFIINYLGLARRPKAPENPFEGNTLEWATDSPPAEYNFKKIPVVTSARPLWEARTGQKDIEH
ncbi:MAG: cbb3-type cytochrome c oxidase subunit I [Thermoflexales bacterium]|nr:cbb3-type cytochrome c oxidase subunit I [Thermoflexales bacterium]